MIGPSMKIESNKTGIRGILSADIQARHSSAFSFMDTLNTTL